MSSYRKHIEQSIAHLKSMLAKDNTSGFRSYIKARCTPELLTAIREQKVALKALPESRDSVVNALTKAAKRHLSKEESERFRAYLTFAMIWDTAHQNTLDKLTGITHRLPNINLIQLLTAKDAVIEVFLAPLKVRPPSKGQSVAEYEREIGNLNGRTNDTISAVLRAINEVAKIKLDQSTTDISKSQHDNVINQLQEITLIAGELNSLEWIFDSVSYGDFSVSPIANTFRSLFKFDYVDIRLNQLRTLAVRRNLILNLNQEKIPRFVREMLKASEEGTLKAAIDHYSNQEELPPCYFNLSRLKQISAANLALIDAEDDLLAAASPNDLNPATYYTTAMTMNWFASVATETQSTLQSKRNGLRTSLKLPLRSIEAAIKRGGGNEASQAIKQLTVDLPTRSHYDFLRRPFILDTPDYAHCALPSSGLWNTTVREILISGGATGDAYGRTWEKFYARSFIDSDWEIIGHNFQLRRNGQTITDIDTLLMREDLLIVLQIKARAGSGVSVYDHWRNRQTIEYGCRQAALASDFIQTNRNWLVSVAGRTKADAVKHVQPLVLTTVSFFDGWRFEGVPVIGEVGRKAITQGAKVTYRDSKSQKALATHHFVRPEELSTQKILWAIENPLELLIAPENMNIYHKPIRVGGLTFEIPEFRVRKDTKSFPATL